MSAASGLLRALVLLAALATPVHAATVTGRVVDRAGKPIEFATVSVPALRRGAVTDEDGRFTLDLPPGPAVIDVAQMGYERAHAAVQVSDGLAALRIVLNDEPVALAEVSVQASSFGKTGKAEGPVLRRLDVYTTPGGAADVFQSLRALPGSNAPVEGAAVYVRGGSPDETLIRLDGGEIGHPYHYERASGGLFSTLDAYMLKSAFFSSGGFSAKYGGVLSGVLDIETQDPMNLKTVSVGANMVGGGVSTSWALVPDRLSFVGSVRWSAPDLLYTLYGSSTEYEETPKSGDGVGKLLWRYSSAGRFAATYLDSRDHVALISNYLNFKGTYADRARSQLGAIDWSDVVFGRVALKGQLSGQSYRTDATFGPIASTHVEHNLQGHLDGSWPVSARHALAFGIDARHPRTEILGAFPADSTDYAPGAPTRRFATRAGVENPGVYLEDKLRVWGPVYATLGARADYASTPGTWTTDPRGAIAWLVDAHQTLRIAGGRYHQLADPKYLDPVFGNPRLGPMEADHLIAGYEWKSDFGNLRIEGYHKRYRNLVTNDSTTYYGNGGFGYARGVDVFTQATWRTLSGWVSYGFLDTERKQLDDPGQGATPWGVKHTLTVVGQFQVRSHWMLGTHYAFNSGAPYTPVVGRTYDATRQVWHPVFGDHFSATRPDYHRLDVRASRLFSLPKSHGVKASSICVLYAEAMNVLNLHNVLEYVWNSDYSRREARDSYFGRRIVVVGTALTW